MKKTYFLAVAIILGSLFWTLLPSDVKAGFKPPFGGEYTNLNGSGTAANFHTRNGCDENTGSCSGNAVYRYQCDGRTTDCRSNESGPTSSRSLENPGCGKTVQLDVFDHNCRQNGGWDCGIPQDYMVWYSGDCSVPAPVTPQCPYNSTQARVQKSLSDPWDSFKAIRVGDPIRVGGFHNNTGLLAGDVELNVNGPTGSFNLGNGAFFNPAAAGNYTLTVTTQNGSGSACEDRASFLVQSAAVPTPTSTPPVIPTPTAVPTVTPTPVISPVPTVPVINAQIRCPEGFVQTVSGSNIICLQQIQNQTQSVVSTANASTGPINVSVASNIPQGAPIQVVPVEAKQPVVITQELPKTGLPLAAWAFSGLAPIGLKLKRFGSSKGEGNSILALWQEREFLRN